MILPTVNLIVLNYKSFIPKFRTPLMTAAADGHMDIVKMLLHNDANVALKDVQGWKAADHAVMNGIHRYSI